ncbi:unnamed protein product, partial [Closterium sp. NIES-65]
VVETSTTVTAKGNKKCNFVGTDLFTKERWEEMAPYSHSVEVPKVNFSDYTVLDITSEGMLSLMSHTGDTRDDLPLPPDEALSSQ